MDADGDIMKGLAMSLDGMGETSEAYAMLTRYRASHPDEVGSYVTEMDFAWRHQDLDRVRSAAGAIRKRDPDFPFPPDIAAALSRKP